MVGGAPYASRFIRSFTEGADPRILFPGPIYGPGYRELLSHALAYVQATEVGGTHPALVEAMGYGNCVLAHDTPEHREVAGETARYFRIGDAAGLAAAFDWVRTHPGEARARGEQETYPRKAPKKTGALRRGAAFVVTRGAQLLVRSRPEKGLLGGMTEVPGSDWLLSLIHISEPTRLLSISYAVFCSQKKTYTLHHTQVGAILSQTTIA